MPATRLALFDIDGTLTHESAWDVLVDHPRLKPVYKKAIYPLLLPVFIGYKARLVSDSRFRQRWVRIFARLYKDWSQDDIQAQFDWLVATMVPRFRQDILSRLQQHITQGDYVVLVSGMYGGICASFARAIGANAGIGTRLAYSGGQCLGHIDGQGCIGDYKVEFARAHLAAQGIDADWSQSYAYADSASDTAMLSAVGHPVAVYPDEGMQRHAQAHAWEILGSSV